MPDDGTGFGTDCDPRPVPEPVLRELADLRERLAKAETEKSRALAALGRSETRFRAFLDNSPCVAFMKDTEGRLVYGNAGLERLHACDAADFLGKNDYELYPPEIARRLRENDATVLAKGRTLETVEIVPDSEGTPRSWLVLKFPVPQESGATFVGGVAVDITARLQAEKELEQKNLVLQSILESMAEGVVVADKDGEFIMFNRAAASIAGVGRVEAVPNEWAERYGLFLGDGVTSLPPSEVPLARAIRGEEVEDFDLYLKNPVVGEGKWLNVNARPLRSKYGVHSGGVVVFRDVTERHRNEKKITDYADQLQALSRRLLHVQEEERRYLARELHDEVGQALTGLKLMLEKDALPPRDPSCRPHESAIKLVQDLMVRVRSLSMHLRPSLLDDVGLASALEWHVRQYTEQTGVSIDMKLAEMVRGDRLAADIETTAYRIVQEALTNVARHTQVKTAAVEVSRMDDSLYVRVEDAGPGFNPTDTWETSGISGMRERATLLGGTLVVVSRPGEGTKVIARLPVKT